jgi:hypothetical protein
MLRFSDPKALWERHPRVHRSEAELALWDQFPAWVLGFDGIVTAANLRVCWLWGALLAARLCRDGRLGNGVIR